MRGLSLRVLSLFRGRLAARLIILNMLGLFVLAGGFLYIQESRQSLIKAHKESLQSQARLIGRMLSNAATTNEFQFLEPSLLGQLLNERLGPDWQRHQAATILRQAKQVTNARLRLYARNGNLVLDGAALDSSTKVVAKPLPPLPGESTMPDWFESWLTKLSQITRQQAPVLSEISAADGYNLPEVAAALRGRAAGLQRQSEDGGDILTVAVPIQGYRAIIGALMLSTRPGAIDAIIAEERRQILELTALALALNIITSLLMAAMVIVPVRRLAQAMRGFGQNSPTLPGLDTIPDYSRRSDEIAELSAALRDMTQQLVNRINTIDRFAADVAHELKNPLTSLSSAMQSLQTTPDDAARGELIDIIGHDVQRLNRLISDISNATRLDAELNRGTSKKFDIAALVREMSNSLAPRLAERYEVQLHVNADRALMVDAQKPQIAQIIDNLLNNAVGFSPPGGRVLVGVRQEGEMAALTIADEGPGMPDDMVERIFERFYTDRTHTPRRDGDDMPGRIINHGHSGLGLSISRQIARAHGGTLVGGNRPDGTGAYFTLSLPLSDISGRGRT